MEPATPGNPINDEKRMLVPHRFAKRFTRAALERTLERRHRDNGQLPGAVG